jgi:hypothetical protein
VAVDSSGNAYTTGHFSGTVDFDPGPGTTNLTSVGTSDNDVFVSKLDSSGNLVWAKNFGAYVDWNETGRTLAVDGSGNAYITGSFVGTVDFDPGPGTTNLTSTGTGSDGYVSKFDSSGNLVWAKAFSSGGVYAESVAVDGSGNVYATGHFVVGALEHLDADPGPGTFNLTPPPSTGSEVFVLKLDSSGNLVWAKNFGTYSFSVAVHHRDLQWHIRFRSRSRHHQPQHGRDLGPRCVCLEV